MVKILIGLHAVIVDVLPMVVVVVVVVVVGENM